MRGVARPLAVLALACSSFCERAAAQAPSFDCSKARTPDELVICATPKLAEMDMLAAAGYAFLKATRGGQFADQVGLTYWRLRLACGSDPSCILRRQIEAIKAYQAAGAQISMPEWAVNSSGFVGKDLSEALKPSAVVSKDDQESSGGHPAKIFNLLQGQSG